MRRFLFVLVCCLAMSWGGQAQGDDFPPGRDFYVEAFVSDPNPYLNEQIIYTFRYYASSMPSGFFEDLPDFRGFWLSDVYELTSPRVETINQQQYNVLEVYALVSPTQIGELTIEPGVLEIPETLFREAAFLETDTVTINVQPLPLQAPMRFNGAVGDFVMNVQVDVDAISVGQPVRLTVTLTGSGNFEQLTAPPLPDFEGWRVYPEFSRYEASSIGGLQFGEKTFEWLLVPDQTGTQTLPPIVFSYFDPESETYITETSQPLTFEVFPGETVRVYRPEPIEDTRLALLPVGESTGDQSNGVMFWLLWLIAPLLAIGTGAGLYGRRWWHEQQIIRKRKNALKNALIAVQTGQIEQGIMRYFRDKTNVPDLRYDGLPHLLGSSPNIDSESLYACYIEAQTARYAPFPVDETGLIDETTRLLQEIEQQWDRT